MSTWIIYDKNGLAKCEARKLEYNGEFLGACSVSVSVSAPTPIGFSIGDWLEYRGERFELNYDPSVVKDSSLGGYGEGFVYENVVFNSLSDELTRCDFLDVVPSDNGMHYSSLPTFSFFAENIYALVERIQANLDRVYKADKAWTLKIHPEYTSDKNANISASNLTCWDALALVHSTFGANFTIKGRTITIGASGIAVGNLFSYGKGNGLYSIERNAESNQKIITRLRAYGSTRNMPTGYYRNIEGGNVPNNMAVTHLMLPSFPSSTLDPYIDSKNLSELGVREGTVFFDGSGDLEEIYPTMEGITAEDLKSAGINVDSEGFLDEVVSAEQIADDGIAPEEGEIQATFTITIKDVGFDINEHLSTSGNATISMKNGMCGGREFEIVECKKEESNYVLTCNRVEDASLGLYFPYKDYQIKEGDKFVLLNLEMPDVYIKAASQRLLSAATGYLAKNDYVRYSFTPRVDNIMLAKQHDEAVKYGLVSIHDTIKEGDFILFEDNDLGVSGSITIDALSIKENAEESLIPEYEITLKEEKTVGTIEKIQNQISSILNGSTGAGGGGGGVTNEQVKSILEAIGGKLFLSKQKDDKTPFSLGVGKNLSVGESVKVGDFVEGTLGSGASTFMRDGSSYSEVDFLKVRKKATFTNITIQELKHVGGEIILSPAAMVVSKVEEKADGSGYICYFDSEDSDGRKIYNEFELDDLARCQTFNLSPKGADDLIGNHYYWRKVIEVGENFIVLSKKEFEYDDNSDIPQVGDNICQLGNTTNTSRQAAVIISAYGEDAPSYKQYSGVDGFSLDGKQVTKLSPYGNEITGKVIIEKGSKGWENFEGLPEEIQKAAGVIETIEYGKNNLLRNSGFTGDYVTASLGGDTSLKGTSQMFSPSLKYWEATNATAQESELSESGKEVLILSGGSLQQTMFFKVIANERYIFSFRGKGQSITFSVGGYVENISLTSEWASYVSKFTTSFEGQIFSIRVTGDCTLCELQLERGTVKSAWGISPLDNRSELAKYDSLTYLQAALKGETDILGGLINTGLINMGMYDEQGNMTKSTAGINGLYNEDRSIAFWAGGNSEQAAYTEATYLDNPNYIPTQEELNKMAKFVVTHGGRAILNDIILRGYIYALGGRFKGEVEATSGVFKNVKSPNNHFVIDDSGNVKIVGTIETSFNGKRIVLDAETKSVIMYDEIGRETAKMTFVGDVGESWTYGIMDLKRYVGDSDVVQMESHLTPNGLDINDFSDGWEHHSSFSTDGMQSVSESNNQSESFFGLSRTYDGYLPVGWETVARADRFCSGRFQGITESIVINANGANHYLDFVGGILVGDNRVDKEE